MRGINLNPMQATAINKNRYRNLAVGKSEIVAVTEEVRHITSSMGNGMAVMSAIDECTYIAPALLDSYRMR